MFLSFHFLFSEKGRAAGLLWLWYGDDGGCYLCIKRGAVINSIIGCFEYYCIMVAVEKDVAAQ